MMKKKNTLCMILAILVITFICVGLLMSEEKVSKSAILANVKEYSVGENGTTNREYVRKYDSTGQQATGWEDNIYFFKRANTLDYDENGRALGKTQVTNVNGAPIGEMYIFCVQQSVAIAVNTRAVLKNGEATTRTVGRNNRSLDCGGYI